jgi:hypothetical protein
MVDTGEVIGRFLTGVGALTLTTIVVVTGSFAMLQLMDISAEQTTIAVNQSVDWRTPTLRFSVEQAEEFNRVYQRRDREWAWCMDIESQNVTEIYNPVKADTNVSSVMSWCQGRSDGTVHTHPSSSDVLSRDDRVSGYNFSCLVHDRVQEGFQENPRGLDCYRHTDAEKGLVEKIDVVVEYR